MIIDFTDPVLQPPGEYEAPFQNPGIMLESWDSGNAKLTKYTIDADGFGYFVSYRTDCTVPASISVELLCRLTEPATFEAFDSLGIRVTSENRDLSSTPQRVTLAGGGICKVQIVSEGVGANICTLEWTPVRGREGAKYAPAVKSNPKTRAR